nr:LysR family transcriptional regulator [Bosea sp. ASV33]
MRRALHARLDAGAVAGNPARRPADVRENSVTFNRLRFIRQVDLFSLKLFLSAVEEQQIGRAAIRENIAASTATKRIQDLEEIAGVPLFERTPKGVVPSPAGAVLARYLRSIFGQIEDMRAEITGFDEGVRGEITIASARSIIAPFLAHEIGEFRREFPGVELVVRELENAEIVPAVVQGEADIGVFAAAPGLELEGADVATYRNDRLVAVVPKGHHLEGRQSVTFADLVPENLVPVRAMLGAFETAAKRIGYDYEPKFSVRSAEVAISLVEAGLGVTVQPECLVGKEFERVATIELAESWANRVISIATAHGRRPSSAAAALIDQLLDRPLDTPRAGREPRRFVTG